jgi:hypothetical protein
MQVFHGASRTRTGDLLGAIQEGRHAEPAAQAGFRAVGRLETPRIPRTYPAGSSPVAPIKVPAKQPYLVVRLDIGSRPLRLSGRSGQAHTATRAGGNEGPSVTCYGVYSSALATGSLPQPFGLQVASLAPPR